MSSETTAAEHYEKAQDHIAKGEDQEALGVLVKGFTADAKFKPFYELAASCLDRLGGKEEAEMFLQALDNFDVIDPFLRLGDHFVDVGHYHLAKPFLLRALTFDAVHVDAAHNLSIAYARRFQIEEGLTVLESVDVNRDLWAMYFLAKLRVLAGRIDSADPILEGIEHFLSTTTDEHPALDMARAQTRELRAVQERYRVIGQPEIHIRDWQFIQYGSVMLDFMQPEEHEDAEYVAGGRYVASWGSHEAIHGTLHKLKSMAEGLDLEFDEIQVLPDRDSQVLGKVASVVFGLPARLISASSPARPGLVIAADSASYNDFDAFEEVLEGQWLYAHNHNWLRAARFCPDVMGHMSQHYSFPWDGGAVRVDPDTKEVERLPADEREPDVIAEEILASEVKTSLHVDDLIYYTNKAKYLVAVGDATLEVRSAFKEESPVPGSYFG